MSTFMEQIFPGLPLRKRPIFPSHLYEGADFSVATFTEGADFSDATFKERADFSGPPLRKGRFFRGQN